MPEFRTSRRVFILDEGDNHARTVVTAAHEMLHLAYRRLSKERKDELVPLLDQAMAMYFADRAKVVAAEAASA